MKRIQAVMATVALLVASSASAATLSVETGVGTKVMAVGKNDYQNTAIVLKLPLSKYTFIQHRLGTLGGGVTTSIALGVQSTGRLRVSASLGGAYLDSVPVELTGHAQFIISVGAEYDLTDRLFLSGNIRHLSNGSKLFGHNQRPNDGVDSVLFGWGIRF